MSEVSRILIFTPNTVPYPAIPVPSALLLLKKKRSFIMLTACDDQC